MGPVEHRTLQKEVHWWCLVWKVYNLTLLSASSEASCVQLRCDLSASCRHASPFRYRWPLSVIMFFHSIRKVYPVFVSLAQYKLLLVILAP